MRKIKISELPLYTSLKGLFTIGTDSLNRSVKVSLEFVEEITNSAAQYAKSKTDEAVENAETATNSANKAATNAQDKANATQLATEACNTATSNANNATTNAKQATAEATDATRLTIIAKTNADEATELANQAAANADEAYENAVEATELAEVATTAANQATNSVLSAWMKLIPTGLSVSCLRYITIGNLAEKYIKAILAPAGTMNNIMFISDNRAVSVSPNGRITVIGKGISVVHVVPTCNTALIKTVLIEVGDPTMRLINTRNKMRFTSSGAIRLN